MNKKHYVVFRDKNGSIKEIPTNDFAKLYPTLFEKKTANNDAINLQLLRHHNSTIVSDDEKIICYNLFDKLPV